MDKKLPLNMDDEMLDDDFDAPAESEVQYNEEMSRQAVGKLFADSGKSDTGRSPLVKGFGRDSAEERPSRQTGRTVLLDDAEETPKEKPREIRVVERGRRRDSATTRITQPEGREEAFQNGVRAATGRRPEVDGKQTPDARAAVQKSDTSPRQRVQRAQINEAAKPAQTVPAEDSGALDFDGFRQRYNPNELVSPPRNRNRPVRNAASRDVRKDRVKISDGDLETINTFRLAILGSCIVVLALIGFLSFQVMSLRGQRNYANEQIAQLGDARDANIELNAQNQSLREQLATATNRAQLYYNVLTQANINPYAPPEDQEDPTQNQQQTGRPGSPPSPALPTTHTVQSGDNLAAIAVRFFGLQFDLNNIEYRNIVINHIARDNSPPINLNNLNHLEVGWVLNINPFPDNASGDD